MEYRVELAARAARDLEILYVEKNAAESQAAARWYNGLEDAVFSLGAHPHRCPVGVIAEDVINPTLSSLEERREPAAERAVLFGEGIERRPGVIAGQTDMLPS